MVGVGVVYGQRFSLVFVHGKKNGCAFSNELNEMDHVDVQGALCGRVACFY